MTGPETRPSQQHHHHRSSLKQVNKAFKGTTAAKRAEMRGKVFRDAPRNPRASSGATMSLSKVGRANRAAQQMEAKREAAQHHSHIYSGPDGLARALCILPLSDTADCAGLRGAILEDAEGNVVYREKQKRKYCLLGPSPQKDDYISAIDQVSTADTVLFVVDLNDSPLSCHHNVLSLVRAIGMSSAMAVFITHHMQPAKQRKDQEERWRAIIQAELPALSTVFVVDLRDFAVKRDLFFFALSNVPLRGISWRDLRPYLIIDQQAVSEGRTAISGQIRGRNLNPNQTVCIPGAGDFKMHKIQLLSSRNGSSSSPSIQVDESVAYSSVAGGECPLPVDDHSVICSRTADEEAAGDVAMEPKPNAMLAPKGTSSYQASWMPDDGDDEDAGDDGSMGANSCDSEELVDVMETEDGKSVTFAEDVVIDETEQLRNYRSQRDCSEFPDEIELAEDASAKEVLKKYRAVKSLRTSEWDLNDTLPPEYSSVFAFQNYKLTRKRAVQQLPDTPFDVGCRVSIFLDAIIDANLVGKSAFCLLGHEDRASVLNFTIKRTRQADGLLVRSKERMLLVAGMRRLWVNPIFSEHNDHNLHKFLKELPDSGVHTGSVFAPVTYDPCPVLLFRESLGRLEFVLSGSVLSNDPNRVVLKRITLTGAPFKIHKRIVVVRFMFFNPADVNYFRPVELLTKHRRRGHIKESLGTHGHMKCVFDKQIQHHDTVFLHLFKRVFPKWTTEQIIY